METTPPPQEAPGSLIAGQFRLGPALAEAGGGLASFAAIDGNTGRGNLMAVQVRRAWPARARALQILNRPIEGLLHPIAHGPASAPSGEGGYFIVCPAPPGPSLAEPAAPWREAELLDYVLRPIAQTLEALHASGVTHRGIRPNNVFRSGPGQKVVLGASWAAPPASLQPAQFEAPETAMCLPAGRGDGAGADDIYALGVLLLHLALGRLPLAELDDTEIIQRKLDLGSFAALAEESRLPPMIGDLVRSMLAEDPEHRPSATLLLDPPAARAQRVAARPSRRAQRTLELGGPSIWNTRQLAHGLVSHSGQGLAALRAGVVDHWLRRGIGDGTMAAHMDELVRQRAAEPPGNDTAADGMLLLRAIALLDPLAPLCWRGLAVWPDGIGPALAASMETDPGVATRLEELITAEAGATWAPLRGERCDAPMLRTEARQMRATLRLRGSGGGIARLLYQLNPLLPCASKLLSGRFVARLADLLPALDEAAGRNEPSATPPLDGHIAAFIAARSEHRLDNDVATLTGTDTNAAGALAQLRLLALLQARESPRPVPALAGWVAARSLGLAAVFHHHGRRAQVEARIQELARTGMLAPILALIEESALRATDQREAREAAKAVGRIDAELTRLRNGGTERAELAHRLGQEAATGLGLATLAAILTIAALG